MLWGGVLGFVSRFGSFPAVVLMAQTTSRQRGSGGRMGVWQREDLPKRSSFHVYHLSSVFARLQKHSFEPFASKITMTANRQWLTGLRRSAIYSGTLPSEPWNTSDRPPIPELFWTLLSLGATYRKALEGIVMLLGSRAIFESGFLPGKTGAEYFRL